jgi:hypothetical protein
VSQYRFYTCMYMSIFRWVVLHKKNVAGNGAVAKIERTFRAFSRVLVVRNYEKLSVTARRYRIPE